MTYYCRDTFGEVQLGEITDESNNTLAKDQIFLSTEKYEIVKHQNELKVCRGECPSLMERMPLILLQTFYKLNAPSEFLPASRMKSYSFRIIQSCLNSNKVRPTNEKLNISLRLTIQDLGDCLDWFKKEFNHFYKDFGQFDFVYVLNYTETKTIEGILPSLIILICFFI